MAIDNRHDFHAFSALGRSNFCPAALRHDEGRLDEALLFIERASVAKLVSNVHQDPAQNFVSAPSLKSVDAQFCSSDSFAAAYAIARLC
ncbi:MAG TPA: hypothetical protein VGJ20_13800 [Xanthobacteraceae bacterium]